MNSDTNTPRGTSEQLDAAKQEHIECLMKCMASTRKYMDHILTLTPTDATRRDYTNATKEYDAYRIKLLEVTGEIPPKKPTKNKKTIGQRGYGG